MTRLLIAIACLSALRLSAMDVRAFGAKGDGVADDTFALQKAADAVFARQVKRPPQVTRHWTTGWDCPEEELFFPSGTYRITGPVVFRGNVMLRGEKGACVRNDNPAAMSFSFTRTLRVAVRGLGFSGGSIQLDHWTANADTATFLVSDCTFSGATETGIVSVGRDETGTKTAPNSTSIIVERCRVDGLARAARMASDGIIVRDCEFAAPPAPDCAVLDFGTVANVMRSSIRVVGKPASGQCAIRFRGAQNVASQLAIAADGDLTAVMCDMTPRAHYAAPKLSLTDLTLDTGNGPVVRFPAKKLAQMVVVNGLSRKGSLFPWLGSRERQRVFAFDAEPTDADLKEWATAAKNDGRTCKIPPLPVKACFSVSLARIDEKAFDPALPTALRSLVRDARPEVRRGYEERHVPVVEEWPEIVGTGFGADDPGESGDDTDAVRALLAQAAARDGTTVVLPSRWLRVRGPLAIPPRTHLTARGRAFLTAITDDAPVFTVADATDVRLENLAVTRGRNAVTVTVGSGLVRVRNCYFYDQLKASVSVPAVAPSLRIEVTGGLAYTPYVYDGGANPMLVDGTWYSTAPNRPKGVNEKAYAAMTNRAGGRLLLYDVLGVPCYFGNIPMGEIENDGVAAVGHYSWVANRGTLRIVNSRLGGEWNGLTIAYALGADASTYIEGGADACYSRWLRGGKSHVIADRADADVTFVDATGFDYFAAERTPLARFLDGNGKLQPIHHVDVGSFPFDVASLQRVEDLGSK